MVAAHDIDLGAGTNTQTITDNYSSKLVAELHSEYLIKRKKNINKLRKLQLLHIKTYQELKLVVKTEYN